MALGTGLGLPRKLVAAHFSASSQVFCLGLFKATSLSFLLLPALSVARSLE